MLPGVGLLINAVLFIVKIAYPLIRYTVVMEWHEAQVSYTGFYVAYMTHLKAGKKKA